MAGFLLLFSICCITGMTWRTISLLTSFREARSIGLPIIISPTRTLDPLWIMLYKTTPILTLLQRLPFSLGRWARYSSLDWQFDDKDAVHRELGPAFVLCTPGLNEVHIADPSAAHAVLTRGKEIIKPLMMYGQYPKAHLKETITCGKPLNVFGPNVDAVEGETWQRHRRLTAPSFNERVSGTVWSEARRQSAQMLIKWVERGFEGTRDIVDDTAAVTLHVLACAGLGIRQDFEDEHKQVESPHRLTYREALLIILRNFTLLVFLPMNWMHSKLMPQTVKRVGEACDEFKLYMKEMVEKEKLAAGRRRSDDEGDNLLSALVRASEAAAAGGGGGEKTSLGRSGLEDDEIYGNLFIYNLAGHETTANAIATAVAYLAARPQWQDWLYEEICRVAPESDSQLQNWEYEALYPRLTRCQAVMLETLRIHGSVIFIPRITSGSGSCVLDIAGREHIIPSGTFLVTNSQALHCSQEIWGPDALQFRPGRWIKKPGVPGSEELCEPPPGTFVPWADGLRVCPGKKFAQVEFAAVMAVLFRQHRVRAKQETGESAEQTLKKLERMIDDAGITAITLQMRHPQRVALVWTKRELE